MSQTRPVLLSDLDGDGDLDALLVGPGQAELKHTPKIAPLLILKIDYNSPRNGNLFEMPGVLRLNIISKDCRMVDFFYIFKDQGR
jgi:hypothetical protein